jgi:hypothetical protein
MQNFEQTSSDLRVLTDAELDEISGAGIKSFFKKVANFIKDLFDGPGDHRRPTDRPE